MDKGIGAINLILCQPSEIKRWLLFFTLDIRTGVLYNYKYEYMFEFSRLAEKTDFEKDEGWMGKEFSEWQLYSQQVQARVC